VSATATPRVVKAVQDQIARLTHTCVMVTPYEPYVEVCEKLNALTPGDHDKRSALFNSGAEAVENAVKIARHFTGRQAIVAFDHAYHGRTNLTLGMTAKNMPYKDRFGPFAGELYRVPMAYPYRWPGGEKACESDAFDSITDQVHAQVGGAQHRRGHHRADPGRGRLHRPAGGLPARAGAVVPRARHPLHRRRGAVRLLPHAVTGSPVDRRGASCRT
jgi:hypothetical protein